MDERRARIIAAAREELVTAPRFTLEAVAERSGVSRVTVYAQFGDRDTLLEIVYDDLAASGGLDRIPEAFAASGQAAALDIVVDVFCHFYTVHRDVIRRLHALRAVGAGAISGQSDRNERRRQLLSALLSRSGVDDPQLVNTLQALTSFAFVNELAGDERTPDDVAGDVRKLVSSAIAAQA